MTYSAEAERESERAWLVDLVKDNDAWDAYVIDRAAKLAKADQFLHRELPKQVRDAIAARKAAPTQPEKSNAI
jgi:hypothetical protein